MYLFFMLYSIFCVLGVVILLSSQVVGVSDEEEVEVKRRTVTINYSKWVLRSFSLLL
jgi:hypothetical protein